MSQANPTSEFELAAEHDAAGRHQDAIGALARGTHAGHLQCMTQLGKRLLTGDRAPLLAAEGAGFLWDAANRGDAEAAARVAALIALGHYFKQDWTNALRWLAIAAERNWQPAQGQLLALAADAASAAGAADAAGAAGTAGRHQQWSRLAKRVEVTKWQTSLPARALSADPKVHALDSFLGPKVCAWFITHARNHLTPARVYDALKQQTIISATRNNSVANFGLAHIELLDVLLQAKMSHACSVPMNHLEAPAVLHYAPAEEATDHYDFVEPDIPDYAAEIARNGQRIVTFLVYLNDDYEGGETDFPTLGIRHKGPRGSALFFVNAHADMQPDLRMLHAGRATTRGEKWIVSQFVRSRALLTPTPLRIA